MHFHSTSQIPWEGLTIAGVAPSRERCQIADEPALAREIVIRESMFKTTLESLRSTGGSVEQKTTPNYELEVYLRLVYKDVTTAPSTSRPSATHPTEWMDSLQGHPTPVTWTWSWVCIGRIPSGPGGYWTTYWPNRSHCSQSRQSVGCGTAWFPSTSNSPSFSVTGNYRRYPSAGR